MSPAAKDDAPARRAAKKQTREARVYFRATESERWILEQAAEATGKTLTSFVLEAATREAARALVDRRLFLVDEERWERFREALDRPAAEKPRLARLLQTPVVIE
jgi:uncharacterized protein (DUF1778 family)